MVIAGTDGRSFGVPQDDNEANRLFLEALKFRAIFSPIAHELGLTQEHLPAAFHYHGPTPEEPVQEALGIMLVYLPKWLIALQERLQLDIDIEQLTAAVRLLRSTLRSPEALANLSILAGTLSVYGKSTIPSLKLTETAPEDQLQLFAEFVEDETYRSLSSESHNLGFPDRAKRAFVLLRRYVDALLQKPFARKSVDLSSMTVATATSVPMPDSEMLDALSVGSFLPPIVSLNAALRRAAAEWRRVAPRPLLPQRYLRDTGR